MANTTLTQTGAQVQADLNKVEGLANIKTVGSGLSLSTSGALSASGGGSQVYKHIICVKGTGFTGYNIYSETMAELQVKFEVINNSSTYTELRGVLIGRIGDVKNDGSTLCEGICIYNPEFPRWTAIYDKYTSMTTHSLVCETSGGGAIDTDDETIIPL